jgi:dephospho-CoA kinase
MPLSEFRGQTGTAPRQNPPAKAKPVALKVIGLTGSIGMGKSTTAAMFAAEGVPVHDADAEVHQLYDVGGAAVAAVGEAFPGVVVDGKVDRVALSARVLGQPDELKRLEAIVFPLMGKARADFFAKAEADGKDLVVVDVPLLFETNGHEKVHAVVVVSADADQQRERVLARPGMTAEKFEAILARQLPDAEKRARAHHVIDTGKGLDAARQQVREVIAALRS